MKNFPLRRLPASLLAVFGGVFLLVLGGCLYDVPPAGPSRTLNTWLLGVWEYRTAEGNTLRVTVAPASSHRYRLRIEEMGRDRKPSKSTDMQGWIARVGELNLLILEIPQEQGKSKYMVLAHQLLSPNRVRVVVVNVELKGQSAFALRQAIRRAIRKGELFRVDGMIWQRTGEVVWQRGGGYEVYEPVRKP